MQKDMEYSPAYRLKQCGNTSCHAHFYDMATCSTVFTIKCYPRIDKLELIKCRFTFITVLSSVTGPMVANPGETAYAATKAALWGFTKALAREVADYNITVNAIYPGYIMTPMAQSIAEQADPNNPEAVIKGIADAVPVGRLATAAEVGELAAFLASDKLPI